MSKSRLTPLGGASLGTLAGVVGTLAMDLVWYARHKSQGGQDLSAHLVFGTVTAIAFRGLAHRST